MRGKSKFKKNQIKPDPKYNSTLVAKFINQVMRRGKKSIAQEIVYAAFATAEQEIKKPAMEIFEKALENVGPALEVRSRRIGGATYQIPIEVKRDRKITLAMRWIIESARDKKGKTTSQSLSQELIAAARQEGVAVRKKADMHKLAEINRAFAHYARM